MAKPIANIPFIDLHAGMAGPDAAHAILLRPQSLAVLKVLQENSGKLVTKEHLMSAVWPDVAVTDDSLVQCITEIRKAIGDSNRSIIKTLSKRGYILEIGNGSAAEISVPAPVRPQRRWLIPAGVVLGAALVAAFYIWRPSPKPVELPSIAVLPFDNLGSDPKGDKFAAMMTEDVITDLSHSKDFAVIARNSTDTYKGKSVDPRTVADELHVKYVLAGSVEALPGRVRATAQLIDPVTNNQIWSDRFEKQGDDVFALETEITNRIATSILGHDKAIANNERSLIHRKPAQQWSAYDAYQAGLEASHRMTKADVPTAEELFKQSIAIDPTFPRAHVGLAWVNFLKLLFGGYNPEEAVSTMLDEAKTAVRLDPDDGEAHAALAQADSLMKDFPNMEAEANKALALAPNNADILMITSMFLIQAGNSEAAVSNINKALSLNPSYPYWYNTTLYAALFYAGDYARSYEYGKEAAKSAPVNNDFLAMDAAYLGKDDEAADAKKILMAMDPNWSVERLLTQFGDLKGPEELERLTTGAIKAGLRVCMTNDELLGMPDAVQIKSCDVKRK